MGYIPPNRSDQYLLYGNRHIPSRRGIKPTAPIIKGKFHDSLANQETNSNGNERKKRNLNKYDKKISGKGNHIDEVG